ncbi:MAG: hypothetical protein JSS20_05005, partial [Proteobacteria bacterium]|nr:hypothetical protein [Pseudomonadota bacterium]
MAAKGRSGLKWLGAAVTAGVIATGIAALHAYPAAAQGWWPWGSDSAPPERPPPIRREPPPPAPGWGRPSAGGSTGYAPGPAQRGSVCLQLEQKLVDYQRQGTQPQSQLPQIEAQLRDLDRSVRQSEAQLERSDCYDYFLFSKTLRRTRQCVDLAGQVDGIGRRIAELDVHRRQIQGL